MPVLRIALAQVNATVGDIAGNCAAVVRWAGEAAGRGARVVVFPEMMLTGYPDRKAGVAARGGLPAGAPLDAAAVLHDGRAVITSAKHHLPNYGVFDEYRYFVPGDTLPVLRIPAGDGEQADVAVAICEDLWQDGGPVAVARDAAAGLLVVPNASPYERGKDDTRLALCRRRAAEAGATLAYVNMVGGQDELVFDGDSVIVAADGTVLARGPQFEEALVVADLRLPAASRAPCPADVPADARDGSVITIQRRALAGPAAVAAPARACRDLRRAGPRNPRLRAQERVQLGDHRPLGRDRLGAHGHDRGRRNRAAPRPRGADAQPLLLRALRGRRRGPGQAPGAARQDGADRSGLRRVPARPGADRDRGGEPAGAHPRDDPHVAGERRGPPGAHHRQQERAGHRVLHAVRRLRRRLRAHQGRVQVAGLGSRPVAQRRGGAPRRDPADTRALDHQAAERRARARPARHRHPARVRGPGRAAR